MQKSIILPLLLFTNFIFSQSTKFNFNWEPIKDTGDVPQREVVWLKDSLSNIEFEEVVKLVSDLSRPASSQLLVSYFYLDGSYTKKTIKPYLDSLSVRPPEGMAGFIRIAYLASKIRKQLNQVQHQNKYFETRFRNTPLVIPDYDVRKINTNITLKLDSKPAQVIIEILSKPNSTYSEILDKINFHQFDMLMNHHSQSFYPAPLTRERLAGCLQIASSTEPLAVLYRYMNPLGLLYLTDVRDHLTLYKKQLTDLMANEQELCNYII